MPAQWTGALIGEMHIKGVTAKQLAEAVGWHENYLSMVLNGHKEPRGAEMKLRAALDRLVMAQDTTQAVPKTDRR